MPAGTFSGTSIAGLAGPVSQHGGGTAPLPATVQISPVELSITRTRLLTISVNSRFPAPFTSKAVGKPKFADVAGIPSPLKEVLPVPAKVVMIPVPASTRRMRLFPPSAI